MTNCKKRFNGTVLIIEGLQHVVYWAKHMYYDGNATLSDEGYDDIEAQLEKLCPEHPLVRDCVGKPSRETLLGRVALTKLVEDSPMFRVTDKMGDSKN